MDALGVRALVNNQFKKSFYEKKKARAHSHSKKFRVQPHA